MPPTSPPAARAPSLENGGLPGTATVATLPWHRVPAPSGLAAPAPTAGLAATPRRFGKYQLLRQLAAGDTADVFLARLDGAGGFSRHLALKTLRPARWSSDASLARFLDEARFLSALHHQHIVAVSDIGIADDGTRYLAMDYIHGEPLRRVLATARVRGLRLPLDFALTVVAACASALEHAHQCHGSDGRALGLVHREVTPSNVMVAYDGGVTLLDFGSAKAAARLAHTPLGVVQGELGYMAPEQASGRGADRRSDVYALGILLYELSTLRHPFGNDPTALRVPRGAIASPSSIVPGYPAALERVVSTALAYDPSRRYQDCQELGGALAAAALELTATTGPRPVRRVLARLFGAKPEPWLALIEPSGVNADRTEPARSTIPAPGGAPAPTSPLAVGSTQHPVTAPRRPSAQLLTPTPPREPVDGTPTVANGSRPPRRPPRATPNPPPLPASTRRARPSAAGSAQTVTRELAPRTRAAADRTLEAAPTRPLPPPRPAAPLVEPPSESEPLTTPEPSALLAPHELDQIFAEVRATAWPDDQLSSTTIRRALPASLRPDTALEPAAPPSPAAPSRPGGLDRRPHASATAKSAQRSEPRTTPLRPPQPPARTAAPTPPARSLRATRALEQVEAEPSAYAAHVAAGSAAALRAAAPAAAELVLDAAPARPADSAPQPASGALAPPVDVAPARRASAAGAPWSAGAVLRQAGELAAIAAALALLLVTTLEPLPRTPTRSHVQPAPAGAAAPVTPTAEGAAPAPSAPLPPLPTTLTSASVPPVPPAPAISARVTLAIDSEPGGAVVWLDGERLGKTPLTIEQLAGPGQAKVRVRRRGYRARTYYVDLREDTSLRVHLERSRRSDADADDLADDLDPRGATGSAPAGERPRRGEATGATTAGAPPQTSTERPDHEPMHGAASASTEASAPPTDADDADDARRDAERPRRTGDAALERPDL